MQNNWTRRHHGNGGDAMPEYAFSDVIIEGLRLKARRNRVSTQRTDTSNVKPLLKFFDGCWITCDPMSTRSEQITPEKVGDYIDSRSAEGVGVSGIRREIAVAASCVRTCAKKKYWHLPNPFEAPDIELPKPRKRRWTPSEVAAMLLAGEPPLPDLILFWLTTWMRPAEAYQLEWAEVHDDRIVLNQQKNGSDLPVPLTDSAKAILSRQPRHKGVRRVFSRPDGSPLNKDSLKWLVTKARRIAATSVPSVLTAQMRDLRRTGATWALEAPGITIQDIQGVLRHKRLKITEEVYTSPPVERGRLAASASDWQQDVELAMVELAQGDAL